MTNIDRDSYMLLPDAFVSDDISLVSSTRGYEFFDELPRHRRGYFYLYANWNDHSVQNLPPGYDYYLITTHLEHIDFDWLRRQTVGPIFYLSDFKIYHDMNLPNVTFLRWMSWHRQLERMIEWFGSDINKNIRYKVSALCNRLTQSKIIITTAILQLLGNKDALTSMNDSVESKNVHDWQPTGSVLLDSFTDIFRQQYWGQKWSFDNCSRDVNLQTICGDFHNAAYEQSALNFTNESFHYSQMHDSIIPGPYLTEKTLKCLLAATAFISVAQFDVYGTLQEFGMKFDYGLDLTFDQDPGNITRLEKIVGLISYLKDIDASNLYENCRSSCEHNRDLILSGDFDLRCQIINQNTLSKLIQHIT